MAEGSTPPRAPSGLGAGGRALWRNVHSEHPGSDGEPGLDSVQMVQLEEACRAKDRLDKLDRLLRGDVDAWVSLTHRLQTEDYELKIDAALVQANATANLLKQLLAAMRLPDETTGRRPQRRGARGAQKPSVPGGAPKPVSSLDRARAARAGS